MDEIERFKELVTGPEATLPLDEAALLIAACSARSVSVDREMERLDELAETCPGSTLDHLLGHLFVDHGFLGNNDDYYDPRNSYLDEVLARRSGNPITLSVLTMSIGRRIGVPLDGVGMPGHFLVRDRVDRGVFVDAFGSGAVLDARGCERKFHTVHGDEAPFDPPFLEPVGPLLILQRMLANLRAVFSAQADHRATARVLELRTAIPGVPVEERADLAAALVAAGDFRVAAVQLEHLGALLGGSLGYEYARSAERLRARLN